MKIFIHTWGCQMNVLDSQVIEGEFAAAGHSRAEGVEDADVIVFNTCSVRGHAENKVFSHIGELKPLKARRPDVTIVLAGCMAQRLGEDIRKRYPHVDLVVGTRRIGDFLPLVEEARRKGPGVHIEDTYETYPRRDISYRTGRSQAFVSVMRGCNNFCAYCIVPYVRGRQVSRPAGEIVDEVAALAADGVKEVTLLGQNVTSYGHDCGENGALARLLEKLQEVAGLEWIKFVTSHPRDTGLDVFEAMRDLPKVCRYLHLPAQSGSDRILKAMKRGYTRAGYLDKVRLLRETAGVVSLASDFIVGFPGETEEDFRETVSLVRQAAYKNAFIFKYSPRPGTAASRLLDDVPLADKKRRNNELLAIQEEASAAHNRGMIGRKVRVLVDGPSKKDPERLSGRTEGEEIVVFEGPAALAGGFAEVEIASATALTLFGKLVTGKER
jgi:tRNA-2-methylthio-N6-dimethylallyladenosine synthase